MKFTLHVSNMALLTLFAAVISGLLVLDILARQSSGAPAVTPRIVSAAGVPEQIAAKEFCLVDDSGRVRARIGMTDQNAPALQLLDGNGIRRATLRLNRQDVPSLRLYDSGGRLRSVSGWNLNSMEPEIVFFDTDGHGRGVTAPHSDLGGYRYSGGPLRTTRPRSFYLDYLDEDNLATNSGLSALPQPQKEIRSFDGQTDEFPAWGLPEHFISSQNDGEVHRR